MKIACVLGSPRRGGNSETIARTFIQAAEARGAEASIFELEKMNYHGCIACMGCKTGAVKCVVKDDIAAVLEAIADADITVLASPIYFGQVSGQMKCLIDRTYSFLQPDYMTNPNPTRLAPGKKLVFVLTQGNPEEGTFAEVFPSYERFFKWYGFENHLIRAVGIREKTDAAKNADLMAQAEDLARQLVP